MIYIEKKALGAAMISLTARNSPIKPPTRWKTKLVAKTCSYPNVQRFHQSAP